MVITNLHTQVCFQTWMNCTNVLSNLQLAGISLSKQVVGILDECAMICMGTFNALKSGTTNLNNIALLCVGICEECAEVCEAQKDSSLLECARSCRQCSDVMSPIAFTDSY